LEPGSAIHVRRVRRIQAFAGIRVLTGWLGMTAGMADVKGRRRQGGWGIAPLRPGQFMLGELRNGEYFLSVPRMCF
jgi:hypothetical protein